jgi:glyoxylase-like metal-dependent hydrolase (beta-lactamase superfamily II)
MPETSIYRVVDLTGAPEQVTSSTWLLRGFPNVVFVVGRDGVLVVDTGLGDDNGALVARLARQLSPAGKLFVTTTHFHPEHAAGIGGFPAGAVLIRPRTQQDEMDELGDAILASFRQSPRFAPALGQAAAPRPADVTFDREARLDLGGVTVRLIHLGAGHTLGDELIYVEQDRVLISGDIVQNKVVPLAATPGATYASWLAVLDGLLPLEPAVVIPTHSATGDGSLISGEIAFITDMRDRLAALKSSGLSADDAAPRLAEDFEKHYPEWAANPDWPNVGTSYGIDGFARRLYEEI